MSTLTDNLHKVNSSRLNLPTSNWIDERIMVGSYPGHEDPNTHNIQLETLILAGVNNIICLQDYGEADQYRDYKESLMSIGVVMYHIPIKDNNTLPKEELQYIINKINEILEEKPNNIIYIHCKGGHGRTGLISTLYLKQKHNLSNHDSLELWHSLHDSRSNHRVSKTGKKGRLSSKQIASLNNF